MLDVTFLLLIFFVLTANFLASEGVIPSLLDRDTGIEPLRPRPETHRILLYPVQGTNDVVIHLENHPRLVNDFDHLYRVLRGMRYDPQANPGGMILPDDTLAICPRPNVRWDHAVNAFNACVRAEHEKVRFASITATPGRGE